MQETFFGLLFPFEKKVEKMCRKNGKFKKIFFLGKTQKHKVFIFEKVKFGIVLYFSGAL
jgi:hypothetical protein